MKVNPNKKIAFIARTVTDIGKAIFAVALASYFFEKFPLLWRVSVSVSSIIFIFVGILMFPEEGGE